MMTTTAPQIRDLRDHRVAYLDRRPDAIGVPLVLLHGGAVDHRMWLPQLDAFGDRRVIAPDARGHGATSKASASHRLCDDVVALLDALDIDRAVLIGISMGGGTAVDTALEHPDRVAGVVASGTGTSEPQFTEPWALEVFGEWQRAEAAGDADAWIAAFMRFVPGPHRSADEVDPDVMRLIETMARELLATHVTIDENGAPVPPVRPTPVTDTWARLSGITCPVLGIAGAVDGSDHVAMVRRLAESVPDGTYASVAGSAHYPNLENPREFNAVIESFLRERSL